MIESAELLVAYKPLKRTGEKGSELFYRDEHGNDISVRPRVAGDRIRFEVTYRVNNYVQHAVPVSISFPLGEKLDYIKYWKKTQRHWQIFDYLPNPIGKERFLPFCISPFIFVRRQDGSHLSFVDQNLSNLFSDVSCHNGPLSINVTRWLYPDRTAPLKYSWEFDAIPGNEDFSNAMLRAMSGERKSDAVGGTMGPNFSPIRSSFGQVIGWPPLDSVREYCRKALKNNIKVLFPRL